MFAALAGFLHRNSRRVVIGAVIGAIAAGAFGFGVTSKLSP